MLIDPVISIITACYNSEASIEKTLLSVSTQTYKNIQYIVVDGASNDRTLDIIKRHSKSVHTLISEPDNGVYDAFNKGLTQATGDYIYFLNSDDYLYNTEVIHNVVREIKNNPQKVIFYGNIIIDNPQSGYKFIAGRPFNLKDFKKGAMPPHPGLFVKRELIMETGGFDTSLRIAADFDLLLKLFTLYEKSAYYMDQTIAVFATGGLSTSLAKLEIVREETDRILKTHFPESLDIHPPTSIEKNLLYYKKWLESIILRNTPISKQLYDAGVRKAAIFGSVEMSLYVKADLERSGIEVLVFLDNNARRHGIIMNGTPVDSPEWLIHHSRAVEIVVFAFEGSYEDEIMEQINTLSSGRLKTVSWKKLVSNISSIG